MSSLISMLKNPPAGKVIIHVPQSHDATNLGSKDTKDAVNSQYQLGQLFLQIKRSGFNPKVWVEGFSASDPQVNVTEIKREFSKGWPKSLGAFTKEQKYLLLKWGGPTVLGALGMISPIAGAENGLQNSVVFNKILGLAEESNVSACDVVERTVKGSASDLKKSILDNREKTALNIIDVGSKDNSISFLVYGKGHDFSKYGPNIYRLKL